MVASPVSGFAGGVPGREADPPKLPPSARDDENTRAGEPRPARSREDIYAQLYRPEQKGIRLADMKRYLEEAGFRVFTVRGELADLDRHLLKGGRAKPVHFVVVTGTTPEVVWLHDPSRPKPLRLKRIDFDK